LKVNYDAKMSQLVKAITAASAYEIQIQNAQQAIREAHDALRVAAERMLEMQEQLGDSLPESKGAAFASDSMKAAGDLGALVQTHMQKFRVLRDSIQTDLVALRGRATSTVH
jgi:hypothetical protein